MLPRHFIYLFVLVVGILAEQPESNVQNQQQNTNDKLANRQRREEDEPPQSVDNVKPSAKITSKNRTNQVEPRRPVVPGKKLNGSQSSTIPLVSSVECKADIERYCLKGGSKIVSNLKVLQCINDLDNVSFFMIGKKHHFIICLIIGC
jgi:hypothetical protein